jgi:hypothetical protein
MAKMGRPRIQMEWDKIEKMAAIFCTAEEIAAIHGCSVDTIARRCEEEHGITFAEYLKQKQAFGRRSLRRRQYQKAIEEGDRVMLIWLGKQYLGQKESIDHDLSGPIEIKIDQDDEDL